MEPFALVEGQTLLHGGRFRFQRRVGCGTFALILRALDVERNVAVAIKCMMRSEFNAIGEHEAALLRKIGAQDPDAHCAVVRLLDTFVEQGVFCLVLELLGDAVLDVSRWGPWRQPYERQTLRSPASARQHKLLSVASASASSSSTLRRAVSPAALAALTAAPTASCPSTAPLALDDVRQIAVHLCGALAFVHAQHLIHADVKPENIVQRRPLAPPSLRPSVALIDFGNCMDVRELHALALSDRTRGLDIQTLAYRAPEVAAGLDAHVLSSAIDMWSLGCVLLECASGAPLFTTSLAAVGADAIAERETESDVILRQIEHLVARGEPLSTTAALYADAAYYRAHRPRERAPAFASLRERLDAVAPAHAHFRDFVTRLLDVNPHTRLSARAALLHPFVQPFFPFALVFARPRASARPPQDAAKTRMLETTHRILEQHARKRKRKGREQAGGLTARSGGSTRETPSLRMPRAHAANIRAALELVPPSAGTSKRIAKTQVAKA